MADITVYTVVSIYDQLLQWCIANARARAGIEHDWLVIGWGASDAVKRVCEKEGARLIDFMPDQEPSKESADHTPWFLRELYLRFNAGYQYAENKWVARMGVDQFFSKNWLKNLMNAADRYGDRGVYHCWTVESPIAKNSRHEIKDWGITWQEFDSIRFEQYASERAWRYQYELAIPGDECGLFYRHPSRGTQQRADGCTWLQTKALWQEFGPLINTINEEGVTGDVSIHDKMTDAGVKSYLVPTSTTYHLVRGASRGQQK